MINKIADSVAEAIGNVDDGATVLIGGFGTAGIPDELIDGLIAQGARGLTIVNNNAGNGEVGLARLLKNGQAAKLICSFPRQTDSWVFDELYRSKKYSWNCCLKVICLSVFARRRRVLARFLRPRVMAQRWPNTPMAVPRKRA